MKSHTGYVQCGKMATLIAGVASAFLWSFPAEAYVGPGAGITMLGALWAVLVAVLFALSGLLIWPVRALRRRLRQKKADGALEIDSRVQEP